MHRNMDPDAYAALLQFVKEHPGDFLAQLPLLRSERIFRNQLSRWEALYWEIFGINLDASSLKLPEYRTGYDRLIVVAGGMTPNRIYEAMQDLFRCLPKPNLNALIERSSRDSVQAYAILVRDLPEATEGVSGCDDPKDEPSDGITLEERLLYGIAYFRETGKHLDQQCITRCDGSRTLDGYVPYVNFNRESGVQVDSCLPTYRGPTLRRRSVVA
jgi:hypothetical protein